MEKYISANLGTECLSNSMCALISMLTSPLRE